MKTYYNRHILACELLSKTPEDLKKESDERADTPSHRKLYELVLEMGIRQLQMERRMESMQKWVEAKRKKIDVLDWLNENGSLDTTYEQWLAEIVLTQEHLECIFEYDTIPGISEIFQSLVPLSERDQVPIRAFDQRENVLFIHTGEGWRRMTAEESTGLTNKLNKEILKLLVVWQDANQNKLKCEGFGKTYSENIRKALGGNFSGEQLNNKILREVYKHLRMNLKNVVQYEFSF